MKREEVLIKVVESFIREGAKARLMSRKRNPYITLDQLSQDEATTEQLLSMADTHQVVKKYLETKQGRKIPAAPLLRQFFKCADSLRRVQ